MTLMAMLAACSNGPQPARSTSNLRMMDDTLIRYNKGAVRNEEQEIRDYADRHGWDMKQTTSGLRYLVYKPGSGKKAGRGEIAVIRYSVGLLDGRNIYSSDSLGPKEFIIGHGGVEPGLEEGILMLRKGDRAKLILPAHLAFGLLGDDRSIPPGATLVYDLELIDLKPVPRKKSP
jgi:FKBP-type peptidyl-prolyl cis-trans isomerase FkpA